MSFPLIEPDFYADGIPHHVFAELRRDDPVSWQDEPISGQQGARGYWAVTRHADAVTVLRDHATYSSSRGSVLAQDPPPQFLAMLRQSMMNSDPPRHTLLRKLVSSVFSPRAIASLEERIAVLVDELVGKVRDGEPVDFATELAGELPLHVICELLGVPVGDRHQLFSYSRRMLTTAEKDPALAIQQKAAAAGEMRAYARVLGRERLASPSGDVVSMLVHAEMDGERLSEDDFAAFFMLLFNAGSDTTRSLLCHFVNVLIDRPDLLRELRGDPALLPSAIEECLRFEPPVIQIRRTATQDTTLGGRTIRADDKVIVFFVSANRDESVFAHADTFDPRRHPNPHVAFGFGAHFCMGAPAARLESRLLLSALLRRFDTIERAAPMVTERSNFVRGIAHLPVVLRAGDRAR